MANGGIIGPVVTPPNVQTQSAPGVWTLQEAQEYIRQGLWPRRYDPLYNYTTLLLSGNGANNATNSSFLDSSSNNFTVTRNGNTTQGTFSPFSQTGWGNYFDGTGDYLSVADNSVLRLGTSNFTIECWVNRAANGTAHSILAKGGASTGWLLEVTSGNVLQFTHTTTTITTSLPVYAGNWVHVAAVREGTGSNQFKLYINGTLAQTATMATDFTQTDTLYIGANRSAATTMNGYISNVRIVNGTALYTAQFTPSTTALTTTSQGALAAQVELLTCQSNRFVDNSGNGFTVTKNGDTSIQAFSPFNATTPWDPNLYGGSGYFDGNVDSLTVASNAAFALPSDFTWEAWVYRTSTADDSLYITNVNDGLVVHIISNQVIVRQFGVANLITSSATVPAYSWTHIAVARSGTTLSLWINGSRTAGGTTTNSTSFAQAGLYIGNDSANTNTLDGYLSNLRLVKGTAVYDPTSSTITVPTAPLTAITNTSLLLSFTNGGVFDATSKNALETVGDAKISTAQSKFGGSSMYFDGTGDYLQQPLTNLLSFAENTYTIEAWIYPTTSSGYRRIFSTSTSAAASVGYLALVVNGTSLVGETRPTNGGAVTTISGGTVNANTWYHAALSVNNGSAKLFLDGVQVGSTTSFSALAAMNYVTVGALLYNSGASTADFFTGYIQDLRITKGVARYTENFAVPDSAFATLGNTPPSIDPYFDYTTLLLPGSGSNNATNNSFLDSSANNFTITRNGNTTQGTFSPFSQTGWGNYFDGSGDSLTAPSGASISGTGDFTVECWVYPTVVPGSYNIIVANDTSGGLTAFGLNANGTIFMGRSLIDIQGTSSNSITFNSWNHIAISRASSTVKIFVNGVQGFSGTISTNYNAGTVRIGTDGGGTALPYTGYISNIRIVKGTAVYTSNFTPPTSPLTAISGTSLLTCQSNRFIDNSSNNFTITRNGDTRVVAFSPFNPSASWSAATYGGSGYFDGSGDYLTATTSSLNTTTFTLEFWAYFTVLNSGSPYYVFNLTGGGSGQLLIGKNDPGFPGRCLFVDNSGSTVFNLQGGTINANEWTHFACVKDGANASLWINGTRVATTASAASSPTFSGTSAFWGGLNSSVAVITGYLSSFRLVSGSAVYSTSSTSITVPTAPLTAITNTSLLLNFTNAGIYDATSKNDLETVADAKISTAQSVWTAYGASMSFDGTGDYLSMPNNEFVRFGSGDFTIEFWANTTSFGSQTYTPICGVWSGSPASSDSNSSWYVSINAYNNTRKLGFSYRTTGSNVDITFGTATNSTGSWDHYAVVRNGNLLYGFKNGTLLNTGGTSFTATLFSGSGSPFLVSSIVGGEVYNGYIQDLRITKGIARYTANFQPPSAPLALR